MDEQQLQDLYQWVDEIPLSRPKRNIARDFSDGVLMAELVKHHFPKHVELHNYSPALSVAQKTYNWQTLDRKVFKRLSISCKPKDIEEVAACVPGAVEKILNTFKLRVESEHHRRAYASGRRGGSATSPRSNSPPGLGNDEQHLIHDMIEATAAGYPEMRSPVSPPMEHHHPQHHHMPQGVHDYTNEIMQEKDETIQEMRETVHILEVKIKKLEQLIKIKDHKITALQEKVAHQNSQQMYTDQPHPAMMGWPAEQHPPPGMYSQYDYEDPEQ
eukprot:TRINITY_DN26836_c0_g1_i1.p1 TRINITY_DN26836_c0_g1~~TRINITY_DN26836_c0_g1_i1.p1  ORF type:complete len:272 (-),score=29.83 TRINITY_DN26836_c0_g1_i1:140-955(-)